MDTSSLVISGSCCYRVWTITESNMSGIPAMTQSWVESIKTDDLMECCNSCNLFSVGVKLVGTDMCI